jgi:hypothetical protein
MLEEAKVREQTSYFLVKSGIEGLPFAEKITKAKVACTNKGALGKGTLSE